MASIAGSRIAVRVRTVAVSSPPHQNGLRGSSRHLKQLRGPVVDPYARNGVPQMNGGVELVTTRARAERRRLGTRGDRPTPIPRVQAAGTFLDNAQPASSVQRRAHGSGRLSRLCPAPRLGSFLRARERRRPASVHGAPSGQIPARKGAALIGFLPNIDDDAQPHAVWNSGFLPPVHDEDAIPIFAREEWRYVSQMGGGVIGAALLGRGLE